MLRILLPSAKYTARLWSSEDRAFKEVPSDILEQQHFDRNNTMIVDYLMFINAGVLPADRISFVKLVQTEEQRQP